jgi:hypothetical protein
VGMKKILLALLLSGCVSKPVSPTKDKPVLSDLVKHTGVLVVPKIAKATLKTDTSTHGEVLGLSAVTSDAFLGWSKTSIGFVKGVMSASDLQGLGPEGLPYSWRVLQKWDDGTVRIGQIKIPAYFSNGGLVPVALSMGKTPKGVFAWHPAVAQAVTAGDFTNKLRVLTSVNGVPVSCVPISGNSQIKYSDTTELIVRFRSHCFYDNLPQPVSMTAYATVYSDDPIVRFSFLIGNDTREHAVGNMALSPVSVFTGTLPAFQWVNEASYGTKSMNLADGQQFAFKGVMNFDPAFNSTAQALKTGEVVGFQYYQAAKESKAFGNATLPATRVPDSQILQAHAQVNNSADFPVAQAKDYLGAVLLNPGATGAQDDFSSTMPHRLLQSMQGYSSKKFASVMLKLYREGYRPSHMWETRNGIEDQVKNTSYPDLFCWSNYCPHWDRSWNGQYPEWHSRTSSVGWNGGDRGGWQTYDNQHYSINNLLYAHMLGADPVIEDWLKGYLSYIHFAYFTDWAPNVEAERAWGRSMKAALALTDLFPDLPETALLKPRIAAKFQLHKDAVSQSLSQYGHVSGARADACDPRIVGAAWCPLQPPGQSIVVVGWMTGFVGEAQALDPNPDLRYLAAFSEYFTANGTPKTYHQIINPEVFTTGGIGIHWWSGWVQMALKYPQAPGSQFVISNVKPLLESTRQTTGYFHTLDEWNAW